AAARVRRGERPRSGRGGRGLSVERLDRRIARFARAAAREGDDRREKKDSDRYFRAPLHVAPSGTLCEWSIPVNAPVKRLPSVEIAQTKFPSPSLSFHEPSMTSPRIVPSIV